MGGGESQGWARWACACSHASQGGLWVKPAKGVGVLGSLLGCGLRGCCSACPRFHTPYQNTNCQSRARSKNSWTSGLHTIAFPFRIGRTEVCYWFAELMNYPQARGTRPLV